MKKITMKKTSGLIRFRMIIGIAVACLAIIAIVHFFYVDQADGSAVDHDSRSRAENSSPSITQKIATWTQGSLKKFKPSKSVSQSPFWDRKDVEEPIAKADRVAKELHGKDPFEVAKLLREKRLVPIAFNHGPRTARLETDGVVRSLQSINGRLPRALIDFNQKIQIQIDWPEARADRGGQGGSFVGAIDGGKVNGKFQQQWIELNEDGKLEFTFDCGSNPGLYQVTLATADGMQGSIEFWVPLPEEGQNVYDTRFDVKPKQVTKSKVKKSKSTVSKNQKTKPKEQQATQIKQLDKAITLSKK
jgi:hypothetical protein